MAVKQISVFVENQVGKLAEIADYLNEAGVNIRAFAISDTTDFGILRMIVNDPEKAEEVLLENHISVSIIDVMVVCITYEQGNF